MTTPEICRNEIIVPFAVHLLINLGILERFYIISNKLAIYSFIKNLILFYYYVVIKIDFNQLQLKIIIKSFILFIRS